VKLVAANGDVLFHLESTEESAEIYKFPESGYHHMVWDAAAAPMTYQTITRATAPFWRTQPADAALGATRLENLQREMDGVLGQQRATQEAALRDPQIFARLADQQIFTMHQERERAMQRQMIEEGRRILEESE
jgi:hypothetical protein